MNRNAPEFKEEQCVSGVEKSGTCAPTAAAAQNAGTAIVTKSSTETVSTTRNSRSEASASKCVDAPLKVRELPALDDECNRAEGAFSSAVEKIRNMAIKSEESSKGHD